MVLLGLFARLEALTGEHTCITELALGFGFTLQQGLVRKHILLHFRGRDFCFCVVRIITLVVARLRGRQ